MGSDNRFVAEFDATPIVDDAPGGRWLQIVYTLKLFKRYHTEWVNDDVILYKPRVTVNCS